MAAVTVRNVTKRFGSVTALDGVGLEIADGELVALLGPSGCGKTTLLRVIAGLESIATGQVLIGQADVTTVAPEQRRIGMMFQSYALFPHMTVAQNLAFPLRMRGVARAEHVGRVTHALELVQMAGLGARYPRELSGGQQQRVALARALVDAPDVLLLDEPLSNLDAQLREAMQIELIELRARLRLTTIVVTHDQAEAMSLADRIVLMRAGRVEQIGTPRALYESPANAFAAEFIGAANLIPIELVAADAPVWQARTRDGNVFPVLAPADRRAGPRQLMIRMEDLVLTRQAESWDVTLPVRLGATVYRGSHVRQRVSVGELVLTVEIPKQSVADPPAMTHIAWRLASATVI